MSLLNIDMRSNHLNIKDPPSEEYNLYIPDIFNNLQYSPLRIPASTSDENMPVSNDNEVTSGVYRVFHFLEPTSYPNYIYSPILL